MTDVDDVVERIGEDLHGIPDHNDVIRWYLSALRAGDRLPGGLVVVETSHIYMAEF